MNEQEQAMADLMYGAMQDYGVNTDRSKQTNIGMSGIGFCSERVRRTMEGGDSQGDLDRSAAFIGTAVGALVEEALAAKRPDIICQSEVALDLETDDGRVFHLTGHPDILFPEGVVIDTKTVDGFEVQEKSGPSESQNFQRHLYAKAAWKAGYFGDIALDEVMVGNAWIDRSGRTPRLHVQMEPYDEGVVFAATEWLTEVIDAFLAEQPARKEPPRDMCFKICAFAPECRGEDTDVTGIIEDPELLAAIETYQEGLALANQGEKMKRAAKSLLSGISGQTAEFSLRWVHVNETLVPEQVRKGYDRLTLSKIKPPKR